MRLDQWLVQQGKFKSRDRAKEAVEKGFVKVDGVIIKKPAQEFKEGQQVDLLKNDFEFVGRGGLKLAAALEQFQIDVAGMVALDIGVATGGFTDCLLRAGVKKIYAIDIGKGQLAEQLLLDQRLIFRNQTDARKLIKENFLEDLDLIVIDVSFISITSLFQALQNICSEKTKIIALIKPQFEMGKAHSGVIKNKNIVQKILTDLKRQFIENKFIVLKEMPSPILGKEGNQEYLWLVKKSF